MLVRYKIYRGKLPAGVVRPAGIRQDTRKHTKHCLRPPADVVFKYLEAPSSEAWQAFKSAYLRTLQTRYAANRAPFDELAESALAQNVCIGCSCPTAKNPSVQRCHTLLALKFMKNRYPALEVEFPRHDSEPSHLG